MAALGPREVEPDAWSAWVREALALLAARPVYTVGMLAGLLLVLVAVHWIVWFPVRRFLMLLCSTLGLMVFIRFAWYADKGRRCRPEQLLPGNGDFVLALGCAAAVMALAGALSAMTAPLFEAFQTMVEDLGLWRPVGPDGLPAEPPLRYFLLGPILVPGLLFGGAVLALLLVLLAFGQWFLLPMMVLHEPPLPPAVAMAARAYPLNPVPLMGLTGVLMIAGALLVATAGWIFFLLVPFFGALLYVSYRDVFLGEEADAPEPAAIEDRDTVGSGGPYG
ncbi:MAG: hypothetical protein R6V11_09335 [Ectothiorhodospiraceae bacterium]